MKKCFAVLSLVVLLGSFGTASQAQTRLSAEVGVLMPTGDMGDAFESSPWFGARVEYQPTNPLGQVATLGLFARGSYSDLQLESAFEQLLANQGQDTSASYFDVGVGARVYSVALPFFLSASANYAKLDQGGSDDSAFAPAIGAGLNFGLGGISVEAEVRGHAYMGDDTQNFVTFNVAAGLPF